MKVVKVKDAARYRAPPPFERSAVFLIDETAGAKHITLALAIYNAGEKSDFHKHKNEETMYVIRGKGAVVDGAGRRYEVNEGTAIYAPAGEEHFLENTGSEPLKFLAAFTPPGEELEIKKKWQKVA